MKVPGHRNCTLILPAPSASQLPTAAPRWMFERTHGCWCSGWRMTRNGMRVWRCGAWCKPKPGELRWHDRAATAAPKLEGGPR